RFRLSGRTFLYVRLLPQAKKALQPELGAFLSRFGPFPELLVGSLDQLAVDALCMLLLSLGRGGGGAVTAVAAFQNVGRAVQCVRRHACFLSIRARELTHMNKRRPIGRERFWPSSENGGPRGRVEVNVHDSASSAASAQPVRLGGRGWRREQRRALSGRCLMRSSGNPPAHVLRPAMGGPFLLHHHPRNAPARRTFRGAGPVQGNSRPPRRGHPRRQPPDRRAAAWTTGGPPGSRCGPSGPRQWLVAPSAR